VADELQMDRSTEVTGQDTFVVVFEKWHWVEHGVDVGSDYCRSAWLPVIGPAAWLLWDSVTRELEREPRAEWPISEVARHHGVDCGAVSAAIAELERFGLAVRLAPARWRVRLRCPPVLDRPVDVPQVDERTDGQHGKRAQLWSSRNRPIASRGVR
jgi:hypothetical protein